tara:strand:+ start:528 stop:779 length:252 start_codon:yes stop_codon:yes gene_type:complete
MDRITTISDVHVARDVKKFISRVDVKYKDMRIKDLILSTNDNDFLMVTKKIGSKILIDDVKIVDDSYVNSVVFGGDDIGESSI